MAAGKEDAAMKEQRCTMCEGELEYEISPSLLEDDDGYVMLCDRCRIKFTRSIAEMEIRDAVSKGRSAADHKQGRN